MALLLIGCRKVSDSESEGESKPDSIAQNGTNTIEDAVINPDYPIISIDGIAYYSFGKIVTVDPNENDIITVELPVSGNTTITAFARLEDEKSIACYCDGVWHKFYPVEYTVEDLNGLIAGVGDLRVWNEGIETLEDAISNTIKIDTMVIHHIDVDTSKVNISELNTYEITYIIQAHEKSLKAYLENPNEHKKNMGTLDMCFFDDIDINDGETRDIYIIGTFYCEIMDIDSVISAYDNSEKNILGAIDDKGNPSEYFREDYDKTKGIEDIGQ